MSTSNLESRLVEPLPKISSRLFVGYAMHDQDGDWYQQSYIKPWYCAKEDRTIFSTKQELLTERALAEANALGVYWTIVKLFRKKNYGDGCLIGKEEGKKSLALAINDLMEKHPVGSNADTLNAIEAFLQDYLK